MVWQYIYVTALFFAAIIMGVLSVYSFRQRDRSLALTFGWLTLIAACWSLFGALVALSKDAAWFNFWWNAMFTCIVLSAAALLVFVLHYRGYGEMWTGTRQLILYAIPLISVGILWTNPYHGWFSSSVTFEDIGLITVWDVQYGAWFWVHTAYSYLASAIALILLLIAVFSSTFVYRQQALALLVAALLPSLASVASVYRMIPGVTGSITHLTLALSCLIFGWAIYRYQLLTLAPIASGRLVQTMDDGVLVIDFQDRVVDINPAMESILSNRSASMNESVTGQVLGMHVSDALVRLPDILNCIQERGETPCEICFEQDGHTRCYDLRISPLKDPGDWTAGRLIVLRDITERIEMEHRLIEEQQKSEQLLLNILPAPVAERLKSGEQIISDGFDSATVLFADLVGFTPFSEKLSPEDLVRYLNEVFSIFDRLVGSHALEKIKTIGDGYMVVGGVPETRKDHTKAVAALALDMRREFTALGERSGHKLQIRMGMHNGPLVAGVIGTKKFAYDLWGDTVTTASRMETHGVPGKIQVSENTYRLLKDEFILTERGEIEVRGKGLMRTWFLKERRPSGD